MRPSFSHSFLKRRSICSAVSFPRDLTLIMRLLPAFYWPWRMEHGSGSRDPLVPVTSAESSSIPTRVSNSRVAKVLIFGTSFPVRPFSLYHVLYNGDPEGKGALMNCVRILLAGF